MTSNLHQQPIPSLEILIIIDDFDMGSTRNAKREVRNGQGRNSDKSEVRQFRYQRYPR